ncbi:MAG TPA: histidine kinase dimerization/phospho-acceptor domain-containing protein [Gemmatimonadaceae bacterium]|nr:histidine kinase dimerization/phospho-acceptor domain-containing protein [Gemmatimonadaceae bacterium]
MKGSAHAGDGPLGPHGPLVGGIAHDCNNLLTAIRAYCDLLMPDLREARHREDLEAIARSADNAAALVRQLLTLARTGPAKPRVIAIDELVQRLERVLLRVLSEDHSLWIAPGRSGCALADPAMIEHVLLNLVLNACERMPGGGRIVVATEAVTVAHPLMHAAGVIPAGEYVALRVKDEGPEIDPRTLAPEPSGQAGAAQRTGTMGLVAALGITHRAGGHLLVRGARGTEVGAGFEVLFPAWEESSASAPVASLRPGGAQREVRAIGKDTRS